MTAMVKRKRLVGDPAERMRQRWRNPRYRRIMSLRAKQQWAERREEMVESIRASRAQVAAPKVPAPAQPPPEVELPREAADFAALASLGEHWRVQPARDNPEEAGTPAHARFELMRGSASIGDYIARVVAAGGTPYQARLDIIYGLVWGFVRVLPPLRDEV